MSIFTKTDVIIIGGGALGTFHAYHALKMGKSVRLFEQHQRPQGATVRNFGQIVPSGLATDWQPYGRRSLEIYQELQNKIDLTLEKNGSIYIASDEEELKLLEELHTINKQNSYPSLLVSKEGCLQKYPTLHPNYCKGALFFPKELSVNPRQMIHRLQDYLQDKFDFTIHFNSSITSIVSSGRGCQIITNKNDLFETEKVLLCNGSEFKLLYPELFAKSDLMVTKLQMLATVPQPNLRILGNILTGLSIRRYESFQECPSYQTIKAKEPKDSLWKKWGVHILFKQATDGSIIIGDSHEYASAANIDNLGFDINQDINRYMLDTAKEIFTLENWSLQKQWYGIYSQCKAGIFQHTIDDCIHIVTGIGGKGMTVSAGFAEKNIQRIFNQ